MAASLSSFDVATCVDRFGFATGCCETHCNGCMMLHGLCVGEEAGAPNLAFFRVKCLQPTKGTSSVRPVRLRSVSARIGLCVLQRVVVSVCVVLCGS